MSETKHIALVDCNNFYASCERVFNPSLFGRAIIILSNNDGCAVSRSNEAKALGIKMGEPLFKLNDLIKQHDIAVLSSNYALYGDMSERVMRRLARFSPLMEVYSIDEAFLDLSGMTNRLDVGRRIKADVQQTTGIPVCVGIATSKTLAKLANHVAKKRPEFAGVCDFSVLTINEQTVLFDSLGIEEVWGIGRRLSERLHAMNIHTVEKLRNAPAKALRRQFGVVMERTIAELNGEPVFEIETMPTDKQQIIASRSFGQDVIELIGLQAAVATHVSRAAEKLRRQRSSAGRIGIFIMTNRHKLNEPQYSNGLVVPLVSSSDDTRLLMHAAMQALNAIYRTGFSYKKAGVMLTDIRPVGAVQPDLFSPVALRPALMPTLDRINAKWGRSTVRMSVELAGRGWRMRQQRKSPCYTTDWASIPTVGA